MWKIRNFSLQSGLELMTTKSLPTEPQRLYTVEFCEVFVSFKMLKFYEVTEETLLWIST